MWFGVDADKRACFVLQVKSCDEFTVLQLSSQSESEGKDSDPNGTSLFWAELSFLAARGWRPGGRPHGVT